MTTKKEAATLLRRYDKMRHELRLLEHDLANELRLLEHDLAKACTDYGRTQGVWGFNKDHLRMQLEREKAA